MADRLAKSLVTLRSQINDLSPNRSKVSDGWIGDKAHAARKSDHNPLNGVVHALDITHDPAHGIGGRAVAEALRAARDPRVDYVISDGEIMAGAAGPQPWAWRKYTGANAHRHHVHISVVDGKAGDDGREWVFDLKVASAKAAKAPKDPFVLLVKGSKGAEVVKLQRALNARGAKPKLVDDGWFGDKTEKAVKAFQRSKGLVQDGKVGGATWEALGV